MAEGRGTRPAATGRGGGASTCSSTAPAAAAARREGRSCAFCPGYVDTPLASTAGVDAAETIPPSDLAEVLRGLPRLSRRCVIPEVLFLRPELRV